MAKTIKYTILLMSLAIGTLIAACTQNNGDISPYFGFWRLAEFEADGVPVEDYDGDQVWSFQNNNICITVNHSHHDHDEYWGTWTENDGKLILDYSHHDDDPASEGGYRAPAVLRFPGNTGAELEIKSITSRKIVLTMTGVSGEILMYILEKVY